MKLNMIFFKNLKIKAFTNPNFTDTDPVKAAKGLERAIIANFESNYEVCKPYENVEMYYVGTFDDESGKFDLLNEPEYLFSPRELIVDLKAAQVEKAAQIKKEEVVDESVN